MFLVTSFHIVYRACQKWSENGGTRLGAAFSYYALFSLAPMLVIAVQIAGAIYSEDKAQAEMHNLLNQMMEKDAAKQVGEFVKTASQPQDTAWGPTVNVLFLIVASLGGFLHLRGALCTIWKLEPPQGNTWLGMAGDYALSLIMVFFTALILLCSVAVGVIIQALSSMVDDSAAYWLLVEIGTSFALLVVLFATSYRVLSAGRIPWGYVWYGSVIATVLFMIGKTLLSYYIVYSGTATMYGAAGSVIVFLVWVYYSSQILFFGAELIQARRTRFEWLYERKPEP